MNGGEGESGAADAAAGSAVLSVEGIAKRYGEREALRGVGFDVAAGEVVAVIGPNGAGKTTLLSILAGIQPATAGRILTAPRHLGWVPQQPAVYSKLSVAENLRLFARLGGVADVEGAVQRMLAQTALADRSGEQLARLSGGNRQRVNVAVGLLADPPVLLLDEPSASLDPRQRARLWEFIEVLVQRGTAVLFSTHHVGEAERYAERVLVLADGEMLFDGSPRALVATATVNGGEGDFEAAFVDFLAARGH